LNRPAVKVLGKAARLLELLAEYPDSAPPALALRLGEPRPTVHRLIQDLVALGYVEEGSRPGVYRLGLGLFRLGALVALRLDVRETASQIMYEIHAATEETVYLVIRSGHNAVCIDRIEGLRIRAMALQLGGSLPLHLGAGPRALFAYQPRDYWENYFDEVKLEPMTPRSPTTTAEVVSLLEEVRHLGYALSDEDVTIGIASVGAPIFDHTGSIQAAVSVGGLRLAVLGTDGGERTGQTVMEAAARISRDMGYQP
jgi:DNA-binding IclR family transcriptional regulator